MKHIFSLRQSGRTDFITPGQQSPPLVLLLGLFLTGLLLLLVTETAQAQTISGTVFRDFNSNGQREITPTFSETGVGGVTVTAYNAAGTAVATTTTSTVAATLGNYALTVGNTNAYRVEFTNLQSADFDGFRGASSATSVQFVNGGATGVDYGVIYAREYCGFTNPSLVTSCYVFGSQVAGTGSTNPVVISFPYDAGSSTITTNTTAPNNNSTVITGIYDDPSSHTLAVTAQNVGTTFGMTYARRTQKLFTSAFFKKHTGFGPGGPGAIYRINALTGAVEATYTVPNATTNAHNTADYLRDNDNVAWNAVGKTSLGGMDLSDDETVLYVMNLEDRRLYALNAATGTVINSVSIPLTFTGFIGAGGDLRPFAVEYYRGRVYVGIINTAESTGLRTSLEALVFTADPVSLTFAAAPVFRFPLTYPRGKAASTGPADWRAWTAGYTNISNNQPNRVVYPMPMFSGITFDNGNLIIGLRDRLGDIVGNETLDVPGVTTLVQARTAGDLLRASGSPQTGWTLENAGRSNGTGTAIQNTGQGPGGAEFYQGDAYPLAADPGTINTYTVVPTPPNNLTATPGTYTVLAGTATTTTGAISTTQGFGQNHDEVMLGTSLQLGGFPDVAAIVLDPVPNNAAEGFFDGGMRRLNNTTGSWTRSYRIYNGDGSSDFDFGKANGLGELVAFCAPAPIMIGNRVWNDVNNNGIQDPGEAPLAGVTVTLRGPGLGTGQTVTTNSTGEYYFSNATGTNTAGFVYNLTLTSGGSYSLSFPASASALTLSAKPNSATGANADAIDTDANAMGIISFTLGDAGQNNFTYDAAFVACPPLAATLTAGIGSAVSNTVCAGQAVTLTTLVSPAGSYTYAVTGPAGVTITNAATATATATGLPTGASTFTVTVSSSPLCFTTATVTVTVNPAPSVTLTASSNAVCVGQPVTLSTQVSAGSNFTVSAPTGVSLSSATATTITASNLPTGVNTFTVTARNSLSCVTTDIVSVTVSPTPLLSLTPSQTAICAGQSVTLSTGGVTGGLVTFGTQGPLGTILNPGTSGVFSPTATTTFVASITIPGVGLLPATIINSCPATVTVNQPPVIAPINISLCAGTSVDLSALTGTGGSLSALTGLTNVFRPGTSTTVAALTGPVAITAGVNTFNVVSTNPLGCSATTTISVTGVALPSVAPIALSLCVGASVTIPALTSIAPALTALTGPVGFTNVLTGPTTVTAGINSLSLITTNALGCSAVTPISVTGVALPSVAPVSISLCAGATVSLGTLTTAVPALTALTGLPGVTNVLSGPTSISVGVNTLS